MRKYFILLICFNGINVCAQNKMANIPSGFYSAMYSTDTQKVKVAAFKIDIYPVTNREFLLFIKQNIAWKKVR